MTIKKQFHTKNGIIERELTKNETDLKLLAEFQENKDMTNIFSSWNVIDKMIIDANNLNDIKIIIKKITKVVHWLARNKKINLEFKDIYIRF